MKKHKEFLLLCFEAAVAAGSAGVVVLFRAAKQATPASIMTFSEQAFERVYDRFDAMFEVELEELKAVIAEGKESV